MPRLSVAGLLADHEAVTISARSSSTENWTVDALQVICAWPLSGQYGPGSRALFYAFVIASTGPFPRFRRTKWACAACFAAMLLFPAVAALHGVVIASVHKNGAVDLDIYEAFQTCTIGIIAAPLTFHLSPAYFQDLGRRTISLWVGLILAGLLSLAGEFYRITPSPCPHDDTGNPVSLSTSDFPYGNATCNLTCSTSVGPYSPIRSGSTNNIYVIPEPTRLDFGVNIMISVICCAPAAILLLMMYNVLEFNWKTYFGDINGAADNEPIEGTNGARVAEIRSAKAMAKLILSAIYIPLFCGLQLCILVLGERNFFSTPVMYQTEPMSSIGQWAPVVGTAIAVVVAFIEGKLEKDELVGEDFAGQDAESMTSQHREGIPLQSIRELSQERDTASSVSHQQLHSSISGSSALPPFPTLSTVVRRPQPTSEMRIRPVQSIPFERRSLPPRPSPGDYVDQQQRRCSI